MRAFAPSDLPGGGVALRGATKVGEENPPEPPPNLHRNISIMNAPGAGVTLVSFTTIVGFAGYGRKLNHFVRMAPIWYR